ncbi:hypothetical protein M8A51_18165 [Schlegelella sp. S2-27]|uniref:Uncharacterized protein n=1 Tax=Caldimonas mangrovi TaxID=2944811 RepID=A0ABT0YRT1_9BURK|nr:hypothetical protein [Caldimonas mangrovi]MCM5681457.1 hypothetical protein [Caldimonas mangrovi]
MALLVAITVTFWPANGHVPGLQGGNTRGTGVSLGATTVTVVLSDREGDEGTGASAAWAQETQPTSRAVTPLAMVLRNIVASQ